MFHSAEHTLEIVNIMDNLVLEDLVEFLSLSRRRLLIRGYRYSTGINHSGPNLEIHTSLRDRFVNHEVARICLRKLIGNERYARTDGGKYFGSGGLSLSSSSLEWLDSMNCGVCPKSHLDD